MSAGPSDSADPDMEGRRPDALNTEREGSAWGSGGFD